MPKGLLKCANAPVGALTPYGKLDEVIVAIVKLEMHDAKIVKASEVEMHFLEQAQLRKWVINPRV